MSFTQNYPGNWFHVTGKPYPEFPDWRQLGDMYDSYMDAMDEYRDFYISKRTSSLSAETVNLTTNIGGSTSYQITSKLRLADGSSYYPSQSGNASLWIDTDGSPHTVTGNLLYGRDICLSPIDNKIYLLPFGSNAIRTQHTSNWSPTTETTIPTANWVGSSLTGTAIADNGEIHYAPNGFADEMVKYNPGSNTVTAYASLNTTSNVVSSLFSLVNCGGILYQMPSGHIDGEWYIRKIDPVSATATSISLFSSTYVLYSDTGLCYKNNIYFFGRKPVDSGAYLYYFDTTNNTVNYVTTTVMVSGQGRTTILAPDGCLYFVNNTTLIRIDLEVGTTTSLLTGLSGYENITLDANGYLNCVPSAHNSTVTGFKRVKLFDASIDPNFLCNRYLNTT